MKRIEDALWVGFFFGALETDFGPIVAILTQSRVGGNFEDVERIVDKVLMFHEKDLLKN